VTASRRRAASAINRQAAVMPIKPPVTVAVSPAEGKMSQANTDPESVESKGNR
jgi:hypothetical protein